MRDDEFWDLIESLDGQIDHRSAAALSTELSERGEESITRFDDLLTGLVYAIDTQAHYDQPVQDEEGGRYKAGDLGDDGFLYARCGVVLAGRETYDEVLNDPAAFASQWDLRAEYLLSVAQNAWELDPDRGSYQHVTAVDYETGSNEAGWAG